MFEETPNPRNHNGDSVTIRISNRELYDGLKRVEGAITRLDDHMISLAKEHVEVKKDIEMLKRRQWSLSVKVYGAMTGLAGALLYILKTSGIGVGFTLLYLMGRLH